MIRVKLALFLIGYIRTFAQPKSVRSPSMFDRLENYFVADFNRQDAYLYARYRLVLRATVLTCIFSFLYLILSFFVEYTYGTYLMTFNVVGFLILPFLMKTRLPIKVIGNLYVLIGSLAVLIAIYFSGGVESPVLPWLIAPPVLALLVVDKTQAWVWTGISVAALTYIILQAMNGHSLPVLYNQDWKLTFLLLSNAGIILIVMTVGLIFANTTTRALNEVEAQKKELHDQHELIKENNQKLMMQQEELLTTSEKLKELNSKKDFLLEILAHDLKSPLANIQGLIGIIKTDGFKPNTLEERVFHLIVESTKKSQRLIDKILDSENLKEVAYNLNLERVDLAQILQAIRIDLGEEAKRKGITLLVDIDDGKEYTALADAVFASQIFENLVNNAIKFSPQNKQINISIDTNQDFITVVIKDEGPGIPGAEMKNLFQRDSKLSNKPTGGESSSGLGLSIAKHYTDLLNGRVWCESEVGKGSAFFVELPRG